MHLSHLFLGLLSTAATVYASAVHREDHMERPDPDSILSVLDGLEGCHVHCMINELGDLASRHVDNWCEKTEIWQDLHLHPCVHKNCKGDSVVGERMNAWYEKNCHHGPKPGIGMVQMDKVDFEVSR